MKDQQDHIHEQYIRAYVSSRVEQLTAEAEKQPSYNESRLAVNDIVARMQSYISKEDLDMLISAIRGVDVAVYEYIYCAGVQDGIWLSGNIEQIKQNHK